MKVFFKENLKKKRGTKQTNIYEIIQTKCNLVCVWNRSERAF